MRRMITTSGKVRLIVMLLLAGLVGLAALPTATVLAESKPITGAVTEAGEKAVSEDSMSLSLANEFIRVVINGGPKDAGRFSVSTTGGDPARTDDDSRPLVYGMERPWTSYTTVKVDDSYYLFGGPTERRAGFGVPAGTPILSPRRQAGELVSAWQIGDILVEQRLTIVRSFDTGLDDSVRVQYILTNTGTASHSVGLRTVVDTMLGDNDGAPFRVGEHAFVSDSRLDGADVPDFWQAFDSLTNPHVTSQGTLRGPQLVPPDFIVFSNWGKLADNPWNVPLEPGRDFTRSGEYELDSAIALFWQPQPLAPGESRVIATQYGLAGISIARGFLSLGLSSPVQVVSGSVFRVVAYVENNEGEARDVVGQLVLPSGLKLVSGDFQRELGTLKPASSRQLVWVVSADRPGDYQLAVEVRSSNSQSVKVSRSVSVIPSVRLKVETKVPASLQVVGEALAPNPVRLTARVVNLGAAPAENVSVQLQKVDPILSLVPAESPVRYLGRLEPGDSHAVEVSWLLVPQPGRSGQAGLGLQAIGDNGDAVTASNTVQVPVLSPRLLFGQPRLLRQPDGSQIVEIDLFATNIANFQQARIGVSINPTELQPLQPLLLSVRPGTLAVGSKSLDSGSMASRSAVRLTSELVSGGGPGQSDLLWLSLDRGSEGPVAWTGSEGTVATLRFRLLKPAFTLSLSTATEILQANGKPVPVQLGSLGGSSK